MPADQEIVYVDPSKLAEWLRDEILSVMRQEQCKPWKTMNQSEQEWAAARIEQISKSCAIKACNIVAQAGSMALNAKMGKLSTDKDNNLESKITFIGDLEDDEKLAVLDHVNSNVVVVLMDHSEFTKIEKRVPIDVDQPTLPGTDVEGDDNAFAGSTTEQEQGQPSWPEVRNAISGDGDAPDAAEAEDDEDVAQAASDLLDDEDMDADEVNRAVDIPNPVTAPTAATGKSSKKK